MKPLDNKRALVCGSSQGIGRACAIELARAGAEVTLVARNEQTLRAALAELPTEGGQRHHYLVADFVDPAAVQAKVKADVESLGPYQILVNNTGGPPPGPIVDASPEAFRSAFSSHLIGNQLLVQTLLPGMKKSGYGRIINIISSSVMVPIRNLGVSNTTRGAVANWGRTLAAELAPFGITVNNILPGYVDTQRLRSLFKVKGERAGKTVEEIEQQTIAAIPMGRLGDPLELGTVVAFLASPAASYVTGVNLPVDGGRMAIQ